MNLVPLLYICVVLWYALQCKFLHEVDFIRILLVLRHEFFNRQWESSREQQDLSILRQSTDDVVQHKLKRKNKWYDKVSYWDISYRQKKMSGKRDRNWPIKKELCAAWSYFSSRIFCAYSDNHNMCAWNLFWNNNKGNDAYLKGRENL